MKLDPALFGELEGIAQQVVQHLLEALRVGGNRRRQARPQVDGELQLRGLGDVPERPLQERRKLGEGPIRDLQSDSSRLDLRKVEDVVDQTQQVGARRANDRRVLGLLRKQVSLGVVGQLLRQDQQAVERGAELVRHVGEELGLVTRRDLQLRRLFLDEALGHLDFVALLLDLGVLLCELARFLGELLIGSLQLVLLALKFIGQ